MIKALIGNGGHSREIQSQMEIELIRFVDDEYWIDGDAKLLPISKFNVKEYALMVAVADSKDRHNIVSRLPKNTKYFTFIHPTAQLMSDDITIGEGSFIGANSIITCNVQIGNHAILNRGNHIGHDCLIGNYFSAMPGSIISGNVNIGDRFYIGTNSAVKEKIYITDDVTIGLCSGVVKNINVSGVYVGTPVKKIK